MPRKIDAHDTHVKKRLDKIKKLLPKNLERARKYRSSYNWQTVAKHHKHENPLCFDPFGDHKKEGRSEFVEETHHIRGLSTHFHLRSDPNNLASLCHSCHDKISKLERANKNTVFYFK
jgi:uncharacterized Fe-S cluster-containing MiaB family protein